MLKIKRWLLAAIFSDQQRIIGLHIMLVIVIVDAFGACKGVLGFGFERVLGLSYERGEDEGVGGGRELNCYNGIGLGCEQGVKRVRLV